MATVKTNALTQAIVNVMKEVKNIEKNLNVGEGKSSYKGVADKDVKHQIGEAMSRNGLCILPINIEPKITVERWVEETNYGPKTKQSVFTEVKTTYLLLHESGESMEIVGYGHGVDSQDKSAGKATTYALKYALLYVFMVPTGSIDDSDTTHSIDQPTVKQDPGSNKFKLTDPQFTRACQAIAKGEYSIEALKNDYLLDEFQLEQLKAWENGKN
jgi:hypothetical protein